MIVILAEKNSAARNFAAALGGATGEYEGEKYRIVPARGHLYGFPKDISTLVVPEKADKYRRWKIENLPWDPKDMRWRITMNKGAQDAVNSIKNAMDGADEVCIATDNDSSGEGDLLAWEILIALRWNGKTTRMLFDDEEPASVQKAFRAREVIPPPQEYGPFVKANARTKFDYMSMQFTRIASLMAAQRGHDMTVRQGRLKSVMVYLVGHQLELLKNYKKVPFYEVRYRDENGNVFKRKESEDIRTLNKEELDISEWEDDTVILDSKEIKHTAPGALLDLAGMSSLLASRGFDPNKVLATYQKMYEAHVVSYPRTDDKKITPAQFDELKARVPQIAKVVGIDPAMLTHLQPRKQHVMDQATHGANRPGSAVPKDLDSLKKYGPEGPAIYEILAKNALAIFAEDYEYEHQSGHLADHPDFKGTANLPLKQGFRAIFDSESKDPEEDDEKDQALGKTASSYIHEGSNPKPKRPTMKWLVGKGGQLEKYNVGTGATRTSTFGDITNGSGPNGRMQLIKMNKKGVLSMTAIGDVSYTLLKGCYIASPEVTEKLLASMDEVGRFEKSPDEIIDSITPMMVHDMQVMMRNAAELPDGKDDIKFRPKPKVAGRVYEPTGQMISFNRQWGTHEFTDEEVEHLLKGEMIAFDAVSAKTGNKYRAKGKLALMSYKGNKYWGFQADFDN